MTTRERDIVRYYNLDKKHFLTSYALIGGYDINCIVEENLTFEEANAIVDVSDRSLTRVSMHGLYLTLFVKEQQRLKRVEAFAALRKVVSAGGAARRLFKAHRREYGVQKIDKFLNDYQF